MGSAASSSERGWMYALPMHLTLPSDLPEPSSYPFSTEESRDWYAVVEVTPEGAFIADVRRSDWPLPTYVIDMRSA